MMNTQQSTFLGSASPEAVRALPAGHVVALGSGRLSILSGRVWLTRSGDPGDHLLEAGEALQLRGAAHALVEPWERGGSALIAWQPSSWRAQWRARFSRSCRRCFELMNPVGRVGLGTVAAIAALSVASALFGTLADARVRTLLGADRPAATVLHNAARGAAGALATQGTPGDGSDTRHRTRDASPEAGRRPPGPA